MTSISSSIPSFPMPHSPRARIDSKIAAAESAGTISQTDATALESAVDSIGQSLRNSASGAGAATTGSTAPASGAGTSFKDKLDGLIDAQVTGGTLTDAQATELKGFFAQGAPRRASGEVSDSAQGGVEAATGTDGTTGTAAAGQTAGAGGTHHAHHHGGGGGGLSALISALEGTDTTDGSTDTSAIDALTGTTSPSSTASTSTAASTAATTTASATSSTDPTTQQLDKLISFLEKMRASIGSAQTYGSGSASGSGTDAAGMVFNGLA